MLVLAALAGAAQGYAASQQTASASETTATGTALFKSESTSSMTKQCVYDYLGSPVIKTVQSYELCPVTIQVPLSSTNTQYNALGNSSKPEVTGFFKREVETNMTKQCFYEALGSTYTLTVKNYQLCPVTAKFPRT
jgi:hypothetical protein